MTDAHTPGPWDYVPGNEHHGPYITSDFGSTIADCYVLSEPGAFSSTEARTPIPFMHEMAEANARLIAAAPDYHTAARETDRLALVIESAVRFSDPTNLAAVRAALKANQAAILKATTPNAGERG